MKLYIGLDIGWKSFRYAVLDERGGRVKSGKGESCPDCLREMLSEFVGKWEVKVGFEAGTGLYWVDDTVKSLGFTSHPFHAASFKVIVTSKKKTDKIDAGKIAKGLWKDYLPPAVIVAQGWERELRQLVNRRELFRKHLVSLGNVLHALGVNVGMIMEKGSLALEEKKWEEMIERFQGDSKKQAQQIYRLALVHFQVLQEIEDEVEALLEGEEMVKARELLESYPGIGKITSAALLAWLGTDGSRFPGGREVGSYFGLVGWTYQSGQMDRGGHITKAGPPVIRRLMVQAAWAFLRSESGKWSHWGQWFHRTARGKRRKVAIVGLARKMVTAAVASLRSGQPWDPFHCPSVGQKTG